MVSSPRPGPLGASGAASSLDEVTGRAGVGDADESAEDSSGSRTGEEAAQEIASELLGRFDQLEAALERRMRELPAGRSRIAPAGRVLDDLTTRGALAARKARPITQAARAACESYLLALGNCLERARGDARSLRAELGPAIAGIGPDAARIEAVDAFVRRSTHRYVSQLFARAVPALEKHFVDAFKEAVKALPESPTIEDLEAWYAPDGFVHTFEALARDLVRSVLDHERDDAVTLLDGVREAMGNGADRVVEAPR